MMGRRLDILFHGMGRGHIVPIEFFSCALGHLFVLRSPVGFVEGHSASLTRRGRGALAAQSPFRLVSLHLKGCRADLTTHCAALARRLAFIFCVCSDGIQR